MAKEVELYTTDFALEAQGASYKGLIIVNKVSTLKIRGVAHIYRHIDSIRLCCSDYWMSDQTKPDLYTASVQYLQVNDCQKLLFLHQLTHNMPTDCSLNYNEIF